MYFRVLEEISKALFEKVSCTDEIEGDDEQENVI